MACVVSGRTGRARTSVLPTLRFFLPPFQWFSPGREKYASRIRSRPDRARRELRAGPGRGALGDPAPQALNGTPTAAPATPAKGTRRKVRRCIVLGMRSWGVRAERDSCLGPPPAASLE